MGFSISNYLNIKGFIENKQMSYIKRVIFL